MLVAGIHTRMTCRGTKVIVESRKRVQSGEDGQNLHVWLECEVRPDESIFRQDSKPEVVLLVFLSMKILLLRGCFLSPTLFFCFVNCLPSGPLPPQIR